MIIVLDTFPTSCVSKQPKKQRTLTDECCDWVNQCESAGHRILVPAISYYEALRELELRQATSQIVRFKAYCLRPDRHVPLMTQHLEVAAKLWATARRTGRSTADPASLDADVILAAQALGLGFATSDFIIATTNPAHISRYAPAELWSSITP